MKAAKAVVGLAMVLCLTLVLAARLPQQNQEQPGVSAGIQDRPLQKRSGCRLGRPFGRVVHEFLSQF
jgi:hypothetical protein